MSKVIIFGMGSFAEVVHFYLNHDSDHEVVAFTVNEDHLTQQNFMGLPVVPFEKIEQSFSPDIFEMFIAIGYRKVNKIRAAIYREAKTKGYQLITYISSRCTNWGESVGDNCFIFEDNTIQPFVKIGNDVVMWSGNHIGHHSVIGDHTFIASHAVISGHVHVAPYCFIGVNATMRENICIGESCIIGAGALIMKSTKEKEVYVSHRTPLAKKKSDEIKM